MELLPVPLEVTEAFKIFSLFMSPPHTQPPSPPPMSPKREAADIVYMRPPRFLRSVSHISTIRKYGEGSGVYRTFRLTEALRPDYSLLKLDMART